VMYKNAQGGEARPEKARFLFKAALDSGELTPHDIAIVQSELSEGAQDGTSAPEK